MQQNLGRFFVDHIESWKEAWWEMIFFKMVKLNDDII